eukprot:752470-Hanusia_phi.AAC.3
MLGQRCKGDDLRNGEEMENEQRERGVDRESCRCRGMLDKWIVSQVEGFELTVPAGRSGFRRVRMCSLA